MQGNYARINGINMYYEIYGTGYPLVLLHGGGSTIQTNFGSIIPLLVKSHKIIAIELQAHGRTSDRGVPSSFQQDADDVAELLKQLNISKANILGFSNGGQTVMEIGIRHPAIVNKLIIASAFYKKSGAPGGFWEFMANPQYSDMPQVYKDEFLKVNDDQDALFTMFTRDSYRMQTFTDWTDDAIKSIQAQTLIVIGDQDLPFPEHAVEMHRIIPNSRLAILPGNHGSYLGEILTASPNSKMPDLFVAMIEEFLAEESH